MLKLFNKKNIKIFNCLSTTILRDLTVKVKSKKHFNRFKIHFY